MLGKPTVKVDGAGRVVLAWRKGTASASQVVVYRLTQNAWEPLGGPLSAGASPSEAPSPSLRMGADGNPLVAWTEQGTPTRVQVQQWTGNAWKSLGLVSRADAGLLAGREALALDAQGKVLLGTVARTSTRSEVQLWRVNQ
jgi:hypothetical protein